jgi:hypothetical protein
MNGFIPALLAVMLAEMGPRALLYAEARRQKVALWLIAALVFVTGAAGVLTRPFMNVRASALIIGIALLFAATGQLQRVAPAKGPIRTLAAFWRGGVLILVFALATRFGPFAASFGALAGMLAAAIATHGLLAGGVPIKPIRWAAAALLAGAAAFLAVGALRLV